MVAFVWLLWTLFRGTVGGSVLWSEDGAPGSPFHRLPVFLHAPRPLVPHEMLRPVPDHKGPLPAGLTALLVPPTRPNQKPPDEAAGRAVEALCGSDTVSVRVDRFLMPAWTDPSLFRLGSCEANVVSPRYLDFHYGLKECGGELEVVGGELVYTHVLSYTPPPQGDVIRALPISLPVRCRYNRFHYSYKVGFRPRVQHTTFLKGIRSKVTFSLAVCDAQWKPLPPGHQFVLGEPLQVLVQARVLLAGERLYVDSCYVTSSEDPSSFPKVDLITNYGCMTDSRREGSSSYFLSGGGSVLKFSVDTFLFRGVSQVQYLHCSLSVGLSTSRIAKSCNYNEAAGRWEELMTSPAVCSCCDSVCSDTETTLFRNQVRSSGWTVAQTGAKTPQMEVRSFQTGGVDQEERSRREDKIFETDVQTSPQETRTDFKGEAAGERKEGKSVWVGLQEKMETETETEVKTLTHHDVMSDESQSPNNETAWVRQKVLVSSDDITTNTSVGSGTEYNQNSTTVMSLCSSSERTGCSPAKGPLSSGPGTGPDVKDSPIHSSIRNFDSTASAFPSLELSGNKSPGLEKVEAGPDGSKQILCVNGPVGTSDPPIRGLQSVLSGFRDQICNEDGKSDSDSGPTGQELHLSRFTGDVKANREPPQTASRLHSVGSVSVHSQLVDGHQPRHSSVVTVTTSLQGSEEDLLIPRKWAEAMPEWVLEHLGFLVKQPPQVV